MSEFIDIVFDKIPSHDPAFFIEVENDKGASIRFGEWINREDGYAVLRIPNPERLHEAALKSSKALEEATDREVGLTEALHEATNHAAYWERKAEELAERVGDLSEKLASANAMLAAIKARAEGSWRFREELMEVPGTKELWYS
jgi:hypothetical protein